jgi:ATP-binding cassette subfamily B protein
MIKRLAGCIRQYRTATILTPIFLILEVIMEILVPKLMVSLIDKGIVAGSMSYIVKIGLILILCAMISLVFGILSGKYAAEASSGFARNLRQDMYNHVQSFSFANIDKFSTGSIVTRLTTDVSNVQQAFMTIIRVAFRSPVVLILSLVSAFSINAKLSLIYLCTIPFLSLGLYIMIRNAHPIFERVFRTYDDLNNVVQENLHGIRVVKSFVREAYEKEKFGKISNRILKDFSRAEKIVAFNNPLMNLAMYSCMILASWFGARLIVGGEMTTGELTGIITYAMQILMSLMMLSQVFVMLTISRASAERVIELLDERSDLRNPAQPVCSVSDGSIGFHNVDFSYTKNEEKLCLSGIDLDIRPGETVGVIGSTGSSKTSLVQLIPRLYDATSGSVTVGGVDVRDYDIETLRDAVGMVLQKNELFSGSVKDNLRWGDQNAGDDALIRVCKLAQAHDFISEMPNGYDTYIEQGGTNVSGGQKQRLCIARALLKKPKILILDDSTSAVDTATDAQLRKAFREELPHTTKIIIAQRISSVEDADKIIVLDNGQINGVGTHEELLETNTIYREVYTSQLKGGIADHA